MGRVEEVTLPTRFILTAAHLIATLTIVYDVSETTKRGMGSSDLSGYSGERRTLEALAWTSVACFIVEILGMFSGVSLFIPSANVCYIFAHFFGTIFVTLFCWLEWDLSVYPWLFALFSGLPATLEMVLAFLVLQMNVMQYK